MNIDITYDIHIGEDGEKRIIVELQDADTPRENGGYHYKLDMPVDQAEGFAQFILDAVEEARRTSAGTKRDTWKKVKGQIIFRH